MPSSLPSPSPLLITTFSTIRTLIGLESLLFPAKALQILIPIPTSGLSSTSNSLSLSTRLFGARELVFGYITLHTLYQYTYYHHRRHQLRSSSSSSSRSRDADTQDVKGNGKVHELRNDDGKREEVGQRLRYLLYAGIVVDALDLVISVAEYSQGRLEYGAMMKLGIAAFGAICFAEVGLAKLG